MDWIEIDRESKVSLTDQLFLQIRGAILRGLLPGGAKLPPTRQLSEDTGISRNIIVIVYEQLIAESYIETVQGKGSYVCKNLLMEKQKREFDQRVFQSKESEEGKIVLTGGIPDLSLFPATKWIKTYSQICNGPPNKIFTYPKGTGEDELKLQISQYLLRSRGLIADPENIIITAGSSANFSIISDLLNKYKRVVIEDPFLISIRKHLESYKKEIIPIRVDQEGLKPDLIPEVDFDFILTTPSHQYPLAVTLSARRRIELINVAKSRNSYIVEDDYDSEFRYEGNRLSTLYSLSPERVIYSGTFSKSLSPALRIGFLIVPSSLIDPLRNFLKIRFPVVNKLEQLTLAEFLKNGGVERDLSARKKVYRKRFSFLKESVRTIFGDRVEVQTNNSGLHLILRFKDYRFSDKDIDQLSQKGLIVERVAKHSIEIQNEDFSKLIIAFSNNSEKNLLTGLKILRDSLKK